MQNPIIKNIIQLQKKKSARKKQNLFVLEGIRSVNEIPVATEVKYYITTPDLDERAIFGLQENKWIVVTEEIYKAMSETQSPQGAMAVVEIPHLELETLKVKEKGFYLILENIQDPGNLGTIIRTAHAFGVDAVFLTKGCVDLYSPKVVRSTMGSIFHIPIIIDYEIEDYMNYLKAQGVTLYATHLGEDTKAVYDIHFEEKLGIVIGNEGNGISEYVKEQADYNMMIPMPGGSESLNASVATSVCMYEVMRQRQN